MYGYHDDHAELTSSGLRVFIDSRSEYEAQYIKGTMPRKESTRAMDTGSIVHEHFLLGTPLEKLVHQLPESVLKKNHAIEPHKAEKYKAEHPADIYMKPREFERHVQLLKHMRSLHGPLLDLIASASHREEVFTATLDGIPCKCRPDFVVELDESVVIWDLKTTERIKPAAFRRTAKSLRYWVPVAHYSKILATHYAKPVSFRFMALETVYPYRCHPYWYDPGSMINAAAEHARHLEAFAECQRSGDWSDQWSNVLQLDWWDSEADDEMVEFEGVSDG